MTALYDIIKTEISFSVNDMQALANIEKGFAEFSKYSMRECVMAVDGIVIKTRKPYKSEVQNVKCFRNRKDCYGQE